MMYDIIDIKRNDIVKYMKNVYLVKDFYQTEDRKYILEYYFRSIIKENSIVHRNDSDLIYGYLAEKIKKPTEKETNFLIKRIKSIQPNYDLSFCNLANEKKDLNLKENDCIDFLKSKGYLIYKPI